MHDLCLGHFLCSDVNAHRNNGGHAVFRRYLAPYVMDPDVGAVPLFHAVFDHVLAAIGHLAVYLSVHHGPVVWMHAVGDHPPDVGNKIRFVRVPQMLQHPIVDEIKGETLFNIPAHHASG